MAVSCSATQPTRQSGLQIDNHVQQWKHLMGTLRHEKQFGSMQMDCYAEQHWTQIRVGDRMRQLNDHERVMGLHSDFAVLQELPGMGSSYRHQRCSLRITHKNWAGHRIILGNDSAIRPRKEAPPPEEVMTLVIQRARSRHTPCIVL
jgi:hypothetical protein